MNADYTAKIGQRNINLLDSLVSRLREAPDILFADYRGLSVAEVDSLRSELKKEGATITVVKNRIARRALETLGIESDYRPVLDGPTAIIYSHGSSLPALKTLVAFKKQHDQLTVKGAIIDNVFYDQSRTASVATLPSREQLIAQLAFTMNAPVQQLVNLLYTLVSRPVTVIDQIGKSKK